VPPEFNKGPQALNPRVDGNPLEDITVIGAVDKWQDAPPRDGVETIRLIMKIGVVYKDTL
jgi:hypothetical protein